MTGISDVSGGGSLQPGQMFKAQWLMVPTGMLPRGRDLLFCRRQYSLFRHRSGRNDSDFTPDTITVKPDANLHLKYFFERDVFMRMIPFTEDVIEPSVPFVAGYDGQHTGAGSAYNMTVQSAQPP